MPGDSGVHTSGRVIFRPDFKFKGNDDLQTVATKLQSVPDGHYLLYTKESGLHTGGVKDFNLVNILFHLRITYFVNERRRKGLQQLETLSKKMYGEEATKFLLQGNKGSITVGALKEKIRSNASDLKYNKELTSHIKAYEVVEYYDNKIITKYMENSFDITIRRTMAAMDKFFIENGASHEESTKRIMFFYQILHDKKIFDFKTLNDRIHLGMEWPKNEKDLKTIIGLFMDEANYMHRQDLVEKFGECAVEAVLGDMHAIAYLDSGWEELTATCQLVSDGLRVTHGELPPENAFSRYLKDAGGDKRNARDRIRKDAELGIRKRLLCEAIARRRADRQSEAQLSMQKGAVGSGQKPTAGERLQKALDSFRSLLGQTAVAVNEAGSREFSEANLGDRGSFPRVARENIDDGNPNEAASAMNKELIANNFGTGAIPDYEKWYGDSKGGQLKSFSAFVLDMEAKYTARNMNGAFVEKELGKDARRKYEDWEDNRTKEDASTFADKFMALRRDVEIERIVVAAKIPNASSYDYLEELYDTWNEFFREEHETGSESELAMFEEMLPFILRGYERVAGMSTPEPQLRGWGGVTPVDFKARATEVVSDNETVEWPG